MAKTRRSNPEAMGGGRGRAGGFSGVGGGGGGVRGQGGVGAAGVRQGGDGGSLVEGDPLSLLYLLRRLHGHNQVRVH